MNHQTIFSPCRRYRYTLWREFARDGLALETPQSLGYACFIGLNPSTADETRDDPTIRRCIRFAKDWGYDALCMLNAFAWRDTLPSEMLRRAEPVGAENDQHIIEATKGAGIVVAAWGNHGAHLDRDRKIFNLLRQYGVTLYCLRVTGKGMPEHPLYLPAATKPQPYDPYLHRPTN